MATEDDELSFDDKVLQVVYGLYLVRDLPPKVPIVPDTITAHKSVNEGMFAGWRVKKALGRLERLGHIAYTAQRQYTMTRDGLSYLNRKRNPEGARLGLEEAKAEPNR